MIYQIILRHSLFTCYLFHAVQRLFGFWEDEFRKTQRGRGRHDRRSYQIRRIDTERCVRREHGTLNTQNIIC